MDISKAVPAQLMILLVFGGTFVSCSLDDAFNSDVNAVKIRLSEERSKRLLLQNDVDTLMLRMEEMERTINVLGLKETSAVTSDMECPYWKAYFNAKLWKHTTLSSRHVLVFDKVTGNVGCAYSTVTGKFTANVPGLYLFSLSILSQGKNEWAHIQLMKNDGEIGRVFAGDAVARYGQMGSVVVITRLAEGDEVYAREFPDNTGYVHGGDYSSFSGVLLSR